MTEAADRLRSGLSALGFDAQRIAPKLLELADLVLSANRSTNLVGAKTLDELIAPHLLDSLAPFAGLVPAGRLTDIGSGAGFPGIALAVAFPEAFMTMLEPREKRFQFLKSTIERMRLTNASVLKVTAESAGRGNLRESVDVVTIRAVAGPLSAIELGAPLLAPSGRLLLYIGRQARPNPHEVEVAALLGLDFQEAKKVEVPYLQGARHAWWFSKKKRTPSTYPRRAKMASNEPL